jgi:magnesium-transporting ATPase (P-type)
LPPLLAVIGISMVKDFIEDRRRRLSDAKENDALVECMSIQGGQVVYQQRCWKDLKVGDIVKVIEG